MAYYIHFTNTSMLIANYNWEEFKLIVSYSDIMFSPQILVTPLTLIYRSCRFITVNNYLFSTSNRLRDSHDYVVLLRQKVGKVKSITRTLYNT